METLKNDLSTTQAKIICKDAKNTSIGKLNLLVVGKTHYLTER